MFVPLPNGRTSWLISGDDSNHVSKSSEPILQITHLFSTSDACDEIPGPSLTRPGFCWCESGENLTYPNLGSGNRFVLFCKVICFFFKVSKRKWILENLNQPRVTRCLNFTEVTAIFKWLNSINQYTLTDYSANLRSPSNLVLFLGKNPLTVRFTTYCNEVFLGHVVTSRLCCFLLCFLFTQKIFDSWFLWKKTTIFELKSKYMLWWTNQLLDDGYVCRGAAFQFPHNLLLESFYL